MLEESADHRNDSNALGAPDYSGAKRADPADDEIDLDAVARGTVERADDIRVGQAVQLRRDSRRMTRAGMVRFALDTPQNTGNR